MAFLELLARIRMDGAEKAKADLAGVKAAATEAGGATRSLASSIGVLAAASAALSVGQKAFSAAVDYDSMVRGLATVATATDTVGMQLTRLREVAKSPGLGFEEAVRGSIRLQSAGVSAKEAEKALMSFGNAIASAGGNKDDLKEVATQLSQIVSAGKLQGDELEVIAARVPKIKALVAEAFGTTDNEKINKMGLTGVQIFEKITAAAQKLPKATSGLRDSIDNLGDDLKFKVLVPIGQIGAAILTTFGPIAQNAINSLGATLSNLQQNTRGIASAVALVVGAFSFMASTRIIAGIMSLIGAMRQLYAVVRSVGVAQAIANAFATSGASVLPAIAGAGIAAAAAGGTFYALDKTMGANLKDVSGGISQVPNITPAGLPSAGGSGGAGGIAGALKSAFPDFAQFGVGVVTELRNRNERLLASIEKNTRDTADVLSLRKQGIGGSALAGVGVTATELRGAGVSGNAPNRQDFGARPASSDMERIHRRLIRQELSRNTGRGRRVV